MAKTRLERTTAGRAPHRASLGVAVLLVAAASAAGALELALDRELALPGVAATAAGAPFALGVSDLRSRVATAQEALEEVRAANVEQATVVALAERRAAGLARINAVQERTLEVLESLHRTASPPPARATASSASTAPARATASTSSTAPASLVWLAGAPIPDLAPSWGALAAGFGALAVVGFAGLGAVRRRLAGTPPRGSSMRSEGPSQPEPVPAAPEPAAGALRAAGPLQPIVPGVAGAEDAEPDESEESASCELSPHPLPPDPFAPESEGEQNASPEREALEGGAPEERATVATGGDRTGSASGDDASAGARHDAQTSAPGSRRVDREAALRELDTLIAFEDHDGASRALAPLVAAEPDNAEYRLRLAHIEAQRGNATVSDRELETLATMMDGPLSDTMVRVRRTGRDLMPGNPAFETHLTDVVDDLEREPVDDSVPEWVDESACDTVEGKVPRAIG